MVLCFNQHILNSFIEAAWRKYASVNYTIIGSDNGLSPGQWQATIWTNAGILLIETKFSKILGEICAFLLEKMHLKMLFVKWCTFCLSLYMSKRIYHRLIATQILICLQIICKIDWYIDSNITALSHRGQHPIFCGSSLVLANFFDINSLFLLLDLMGQS